jgi:hypothetical protein
VFSFRSGIPLLCPVLRFSSVLRPARADSGRSRVLELTPPVAFRCLLHPTRPRSDSPIRTAPVSPSRARSAGSFFFGLSSLPSSRVLPPARTCVNPSTGRSAAALFFGFSLPAIFSGCEFLRYSAWSCCRSADWSPASSLAQLPLFVLFAKDFAPTYSARSACLDRWHGWISGFCQDGSSLVKGLASFAQDCGLHQASVSAVPDFCCRSAQDCTKALAFKEGSDVCQFCSSPI